MLRTRSMTMLDAEGQISGRCLVKYPGWPRGKSSSAQREMEISGEKGLHVHVRCKTVVFKRRHRNCVQHRKSDENRSFFGNENKRHCSLACQ